MGVKTGMSMRISPQPMKGGTPSQNLFNHVASTWREAIWAFIEAITTPGVTSVDTGMSLASLIPIAERIRKGREARARILHQAGKKKWGYTGFGLQAGKYKGAPKSWKSIPHGETLGEDAYVINYGTVENMKMQFRFDIKVVQYFLHEADANWPGGGNWRSLDKGKEAFWAVILGDDPYLARNIAKWVRSTRITKGF